MKDILKCFRGKRDGWDFTTTLKCLLCFLALLFLFLPVSLYLMLLYMGDLNFSTFLFMFIADVMLMVLVVVLIVLIWGPRCSPKRDESIPISVDKENFVEISNRLGDSHDNEGFVDLNGRSPSFRRASAVDVHVPSTSGQNVPNDGDKVESSSHGFVSGNQRVSSNIEHVQSMENGYVGPSSSPKMTNQSRSETEFRRHFSVPLSSWKEYWHHKKRLLVTDTPQKGSKGEDVGPNFGNSDQRRTSQGQVRKDPSNAEPQQDLKEEKGNDVVQSSPPEPKNTMVSQEDEMSGHVKSQNNQNPSANQQCKADEEHNAPRFDSNIDQSTVRNEPTNADINRTSLGPPEEAPRHHKRSWTDPQRRTREPTKRDDEHPSSESLNQLDDVKALKRALKAKPGVRGFVKLKSRLGNPHEYVESFGRRQLAPPCRCNDLTLTAWVSNVKNEPFGDSERPPPFLKRSRSAPSMRISALAMTSDRMPIPACAGDNRSRVLHRLLATILTTGDDDDMLPYPELESDNEVEKPQLEVEALPSGDYLMHISMRLSSKELHSFKSRRATNVKKSEFKKYLDAIA